MKQFTKSKRLLSAFLSVVMAFSAVPIVSVNAVESNSTSFKYDGYAVSYNVTDSWDNTEIVSVTITNTSDSPIENWMLYFDPHGNITNIWDAQTAVTSTDVTYFKNAGYNSTIEPKASVTFSYFIDDCVSVPDSYTLCQQRVEKASDGYSVEVVVDDSWDDVFNGTIILTNETDNPIEDWELTFDTNFTITEITSSWAGTMTTLDSYCYMLKGSYTNIIEPHSSVNLSFSGIKNGTPTIVSSVLTEVVVNESLIDFINRYPDGVSIYAYGNYNIEANTIDIEWFTDYETDTFEIYQSDGNENYSLVTEVIGANSYSYTISEDFETKYIKVSIPNDLGITIESIPFVVTKTDEGYSITLLDSDGDGLPDVYEIEFGTDINNPDSDHDGLTDYQEIYITNTDPLVYDSITSGISDANADSDGDGISNIKEIAYGIDPLNEDTDLDNLTDYDEIYIYHTDPLSPDTDEDGINDGDEIALGLNPLLPDSDGDGILDCDEYIEQNINDSRYDSDIFDDNVAIPSLVVSAKGNVNSNIQISEYNGHLKGEERVYVGKVIEISNSEINGGKISFMLSDKYIVKEYKLGDVTTNGLLICYNNGEDTTPLKTTYDSETRTLSAEITSAGIYFVIDVMSWLEDYGIDINTEVNNEVIKTFNCPIDNDPSVKNSSVEIKGQVDIVFVIDTTGSMASCITNVKNNINVFVDEIESAGISPSFALVDYKDITADGEHSTNVKKK